MIPTLANQLLSCINLFGERHSNPVLSILSGLQPIDKTRYPEHALSFGQDKWRVFYHCHDSPAMQEDEHGHFHFFTRTPAQTDEKYEWSHVAALAMDNMGQPLHWFTVNRWVTDGAWFEQDWLDDAVFELSLHQEPQLLGRWFQAMLCLYLEDISDLLIQRDINLPLQRYLDDPDSVFIDHDIYLLSSAPVNLLNKLGSCFPAETAVSRKHSGKPFHYHLVHEE